jgi:glyoxylase-like metal-dependent hydrolase (beta-lactamase superfamily II)
MAAPMNAEGFELRRSFRVGELTVTQLSDGSFTRNMSMFFDGVDPAEWTAAVGIGPDERDLGWNFGAFLVRGDGHTTLIDTGNGTRSRDEGAVSGGALLERLAENGVEPATVDTIVHTHLHFDHCGWDVDDDADGAITFPNATVHVSRPELDYWMGPSAKSVLLQEIRSRMEPLQQAGTLKTFEGDTQITQSLRAIFTPGHTPGHSSVLVQSGGETLLVTGDVAHHPQHLTHQQWHASFDWDRPLQQESRHRVSQLAVELDAIVASVHFPILTLGRIVEGRGGYRFESESAPGR